MNASLRVFNRSGRHAEGYAATNVLPMLWEPQCNPMQSCIGSRDDGGVVVLKEVLE